MMGEVMFGCHNAVTVIATDVPNGSSMCVCVFMKKQSSLKPL